MVFSSALFLFGFLPVFLAAYYPLPGSARNLLLLFASLLFYYAGAGQALAILLASVWINQFIAARLGHPATVARGRLLAIGIALNLAGLLYYKYFGLLWDLGNPLLAATGAPVWPRPEISLPIGISFFTFQAISYLVDVYRRECSPAGSYVDFAVYHTLFPQLVAGPIVRYREIQAQLHRRVIDWSGLASGAYRFCLGLGKKLILADNLGAVADQIVKLPAGELSAVLAWIGMLCYALQIYYDFSGYSDMAIGLGRMLGFRFPENFDQPYRSASVTEFWRRWHMTLTRWFRDYLYIPLGGNRRGPLRTYLNLAAVFLLCGLWHGASLNFIVWGAYHGALLALERLLDQRFGWRPRGFLGIASTLGLVLVGWVFFRIADMGEAMEYLKAMFGAGSAHTVYFTVAHFVTADVLFYLVAGVAFALIPWGNLHLLREDRPVLLAAQLAFAIVCLVWAALQLSANSFNPFIYFRF